MDSLVSTIFLFFVEIMNANENEVATLNVEINLLLNTAHHDFVSIVL